MHDGGDGSMRRLTSSSQVMAEPPRKSSDSLAPFEVKASDSMFRSHSLPQPYLLHPPTHHVGAFHHHMSPKAAVDPNHYAQLALEAELQRRQNEIAELKEQLAVSETGKAQALKEFMNIKTLLDQISLVEHFAASDNVEVEAAPLPPNWSGGSSDQLDAATQKEIDRLRNELDASKNLNSKFAAELDKARQEIDEVRDYRGASLELENSRMELIRLQSELEAGRDHEESIYVELDNAKKDISTLQATLSDAWSHHGACALDLSRAKEEISWLEADLEAAQNLTAELTHAKDHITTLQEDLEVARGLHKSSSIGLLKAREEISRLRSQLEASSSELASAIRHRSEVQAELDNLRDSHDASTVELQNAKQEMLHLRAAYEAAVSESAYANEEIRRLEGELAAALTSGRGYASALRAEADAFRVKYERCSSELFNAKEENFRLEVEQLASHESHMTDVRIAQEENSKLQTEVSAANSEKSRLSAQLAEARGALEAAENRLDVASRELLGAGNDIFRLQGELSAVKEQYGDCVREFETLKETELTGVQELHTLVMAELVNAREEVANLQAVSTEGFEMSLEVVRDLKVEISEAQVDLLNQHNALILEKSFLEQQTKELALESIATTKRVQETSAAEKRLAEGEVAATGKEVGAPELELGKVREAESKVEELRAEINALHLELDAVKMSEARLVSSSQARIEDLKEHLYALSDSEAKAKESLVSTSSELQQKRIELEMAKEALEWVGGDAAALAAELEAVKADITSTKEGEARAKAAFSDYSLKLHKTRLDLEDAAKLADKVPLKAQPSKTQARTFKLDLDEATAKLEEAMESERTMSASVASLKAELNNAMAELAAAREDHTLALAEKEQQYELDLNQMRAQWEVAVNSEETLTDANFALNESLIKVLAQAEEAAFAEGRARQDAEKATSDAEKAEARLESLEAKLETLHLEVEAAKASEDWAFEQMRLKTIPEYDVETEEQEGEVPVCFEEYQSLKTTVKELQEVVNKRAAVGMAQVNEARASEKEMQRRMEALQKELRSCRSELDEAISKREEAEAAKFSCEAALRAKRHERKAMSHSDSLNGGHPMGKFMNVGDRQGSLNSICFEDSQSSSPSRSSKSFASFASPGRSERSPVEAFAQLPNTGLRTPSEESKQRKLKFSSKIGAYFSRKKDSALR